MRKQKRKLTLKQSIFVKEYLIDLNSTQAAIRAGYSKKNADVIGPELLGKTWVAEEIQKQVGKRAKRLEINADYVLGTIQETVERCRQTVEPVLNKIGQPVLVADRDGDLKRAYVFDAKNVLKGCELLGKHLKLFVDKVEHGIDPNDPIMKKLLDIDGSSRGLPQPVGDD